MDLGILAEEGEEDVQITDADLRPSTEKDSPYFGYDVRWIPPGWRKIHEQYKKGEVMILKEDVAYRAYRKLNRELMEIHEEVIRKLAQSSEEAKHILIYE